MTKRLWSLNALAVELDSDRRTVANALKRVPADGEQAGHPAWFILTAIRAMWPAPDANGEILDPAQERARKDRALAEQTEMKNAIMRGEVVVTDVVIEEMCGLIGIVKSRFLGLPSKAKSRFNPQKPAELYGILEKEVLEILTELSDPTKLEAIANADRKRDASDRRRAAKVHRG